MRLSLLYIFLLCCAVSVVAQDREKQKRVLIDEGHYPDGTLEYRSKTIRKGLAANNEIKGKQIIKLKEYYKNGQLELREKKVIPRIVEVEHLGDDRHILRQKKEKRKYKMWDEDGKKIEKGKYDFRGRKRIVKYNHKGYKKVIIKFDPEIGRDVEIKKKPIYK